MKTLAQPTVIKVTYTNYSENENVHNIEDLKHIIENDLDIQFIEIVETGENIKQVEKVLFSNFYAERVEDSFSGHNKFNDKGLVIAPSNVEKVLKNHISIKIGSNLIKIKKESFVFHSNLNDNWKHCSNELFFVNETQFTDKRLDKWACSW